jgi:spermidine synthase
MGYMKELWEDYAPYRAALKVLSEGALTVMLGNETDTLRMDLIRAELESRKCDASTLPK